MVATDVWTRDAVLFALHDVCDGYDAEIEFCGKSEPAFEAGGIVIEAHTYEKWFDGMNYHPATPLIPRVREIASKASWRVYPPLNGCFCLYPADMPYLATPTTEEAGDNV